MGLSDSVVFHLLFDHIAGQFSAFFFKTIQFNFCFVLWFVLAVCLTALCLTRKSVWQSIQAESSDNKVAISGLVQHCLGLEFIITATLILFAYPLLPAPEFLVFRFLTAGLAGFVLVFGKRAALFPFLPKIIKVQNVVQTAEDTLMFK